MAYQKDKFRELLNRINKLEGMIINSEEGTESQNERDSEREWTS